MFYLFVNIFVGRYHDIRKVGTYIFQQNFKVYIYFTIKELFEIGIMCK